MLKDFKCAATYLGIMWALEMFFPEFDYFGIRPGVEGIGMLGIITSPFLHGDPQHLIGNTVGYLPLATLTIFKAPGKFNYNFWVISVIEGFGVWFFGQPGSNHIGASGVIYGFFGFCLLSAVFRLDFPNLVCAVITWVIFQGLIGGMLPSVAQGISWEGHLAGFIGGAIAGYLDANSQRKLEAN